MIFDILTLFPDMVDGILSESVIGRAREAGYIRVRTHNIRDYSTDKRHRVDDTPYGGGTGMLISPAPICDCHRAVMAMGDGTHPAADLRTRTVYLSPKGRVLTQDIVRELREYDRLILLCGHYEGIDQRALDAVVDEEISVGDYVLTGGELPACILTDAVARLIPGVLADHTSYEDESIACGLLEYPQYTRPECFEDTRVPAVLLSGDHARIDAWRLDTALSLTRARRPDLYRTYMAAHHSPEKKKRGIPRRTVLFKEQDEKI